MKKIIMGMLAAASIAAPALADPIKDERILHYACSWDACYFKNAPIMSKNSKQFLTSTKMITWSDIDYNIIADEFNSLIRSLNAVGGSKFF